MNKILLFMILVTPFFSHGDIVFTPFAGDLTPENRNEYVLDINNDEFPDFRIYAEQITQMSSVNIMPIDSNKILFGNEFSSDVYALTEGTTISLVNQIGITSWQSREGMLSWSDLLFPEGYTVAGQFLGTTAYVGICFQINSNIHYGWIQVDNPISQPGGTVTGFAYETEPDTGIVTGTIPEPGTVSLFSLGVLGMLLMRRNKK